MSDGSWASGICTREIDRYAMGGDDPMLLRNFCFSLIAGSHYAQVWVHLSGRMSRESVTVSRMLLVLVILCESPTCTGLLVLRESSLIF